MFDCERRHVVGRNVVGWICIAFGSGPVLVQPQQKESRFVGGLDRSIDLLIDSGRLCGILQELPMGNQAVGCLGIKESEWILSILLLHVVTVVIHDTHNDFPFSPESNVSDMNIHLVLSF